jgi:alkylhydroperoxidase family enzyme
VPPGAEPPRIYRVVARNESLFVELVEHDLLGLTGLFDRGMLAPRLREILILRTCVSTGNDYEWHLHVDSGLSTHMGLDSAEITDTRADEPNPKLWAPAEYTAMSLVDALARRFKVDDVLYAALREHFDETTLIEMTQLIGWYTSVAMQAALADLRPRNGGDANL